MPGCGVLKHTLLWIDLNEGSLFFPTKLTTRGVDVSSPALSHMRVYPVVAEDRLKVHHIICLWSPIRQAFDFVVADEVDVGANGAADLCQLSRMLRLVVHAGQEDVLQRDLAARAIEGIPGGVQDLVY